MSAPISLRTQKYILNILVIVGFLFISLLFLIVLNEVWTNFPLSNVKSPETFEQNISIISTQIALSIILIWFMIFLPYLAWAVYFYNINLGRTNEEWDAVKKENERRKAMNENEISLDNPYKDETFGLPKGTIRGSIAITLMVGALALFVLAIGHPTILHNNQFFQENFEFFKTAFLMMIAFYFGGKSLEYMQDRLNRPNERQRPQAAENSMGNNVIDEEDIETVPEVDKAIEETKVLSPTSMKKQQLLAFADDVSDTAISPPMVEDTFVLKGHEPEKAKELTDEEIELHAEELGIEVAALKAVIAVESNGRGFFPDGRPKILFEGHIFWKKLKDHGIDPRKYSSKYQHIVYEHWVRTHYRKNEAEYERLKIATQIHAEAAKLSTSWGMFQIMGFNFGACGFTNVDDFVSQMSVNEGEQMRAFVKFCNHHNLLIHLRNHDWAKFARAYNGKEYKKNQYDYKLEMKYHEFSKDHNQSLSVKLVREKQNDKQTVGTLTVFEDKHPVFTCKTLELPWKDNQRNISCIPPDTKYEVVKRWTEQRNDHFHVLNVPSRSSILIHSGNYYFHTQGCILVGKSLADVNKDGYVDVTESKATLSALNDLLPKKFTLAIETTIV